MKKDGTGVIICGGGYKYFTNAWIALNLLRFHGCSYQAEIWMTEEEYDFRMEKWVRPLAARIQFYRSRSYSSPKLPIGMRWQWLLKPWALVHTTFQHVLLIDADNFAVINPDYLFAIPEYQKSGATFWPDLVNKTTKKDNPIWNEIGVPYRDEPEFETGQIVIDTLHHLEACELALSWNREAGKFYQMLWGDKDTFRFAFHKLRHHFNLVPYFPQVLEVPGLKDVGVMCQHDFEGTRVFQHRNLAKWDLLGSNSRIPGFLFESQCRQYLEDLRRRWNGRCYRRRSDSIEDCEDASRLKKIRLELQKGVWLLEDQSPQAMQCCGPLRPWDKRVPVPWDISDCEASNECCPPKEPQEEVRPGFSKAKLRYKELSFLRDAIGKGSDYGFYWWEVKLDDSGIILNIFGEKSLLMSLHRKGEEAWVGKWRGKKRAKLRLLRVDRVYPEKHTAPGISKPKLSSLRSPIHVSNHALGIGDAVTGLYACVGVAQTDTPVVYHTRHPRWFSRVRCPNLKITGKNPPRGTVDLNADYPEQLRYAADKSRWYGQFIASRILGFTEDTDDIPFAVPPITPARPPIDKRLESCALQIDRYVLVAPCAASSAREWPGAHWRRLAHWLEKGGIQTVAIGSQKDAKKLEKIFDKSNAGWVIDAPESWVLDAMLGANAVIGVDSGMIHVAGLLGVLGACIHAQLPRQFLFSNAPSIHSVIPDSRCTFCRWQWDREFDEGCMSECSALATVTPEEVVAALTLDGV